MYQEDEPCGLILDFLGWEETYHIAFTSGWKPDNILLMPGGWEGEFDPASIQFFFDRVYNDSGMVLIQKNSKFDQLFDSSDGLRTYTGGNVQLTLEKLNTNQDLTLYRYTWKKKRDNMALDKNGIAQRIAREVKDGQYVNLGIGIPTLVANYIPEDIDVEFQSENGLLGHGSFPR